MLRDSCIWCIVFNIVTLRIRTFFCFLEILAISALRCNHNYAYVFLWTMPPALIEINLKGLTSKFFPLLTRSQKKQKHKLSLWCSLATLDQSQAGWVQCFGITVQNFSQPIAPQTIHPTLWRKSAFWNLSKWGCFPHQQTHTQNSHNSFTCSIGQNVHQGVVTR